MSKPEYGTLEYAKAHVGEWWSVKGKERYFLIGFTASGLFVTQARKGGIISFGHFGWFSDNNRPESDPEPVKWKVELPEYVEVWDVTTDEPDYYDEFKNSEEAKKKIITLRHLQPKRKYGIRHIPATVVE
jgi:hypothetical protein